MEKGLFISQRVNEIYSQNLSHNAVINKTFSENYSKRQLLDIILTNFPFILFHYQRNIKRRKNTLVSLQKGFNFTYSAGKKRIYRRRYNNMTVQSFFVLA